MVRFLFLLSLYWTIQSNGNREAINNHHKLIISDNMVILLYLFIHFDFHLVLISHYTARVAVITIPFCYLYFLNVFLPSFAEIDQDVNILGQMKNSVEELKNSISYFIHNVK